METTNIEKLKNLLEKESEVLITELSGLGIMNPKNNDWEATPEDAEAEADENDKADQFEEFEERSATLSILEERLQDVKKALEKIKNNTYGMCEVCNAPISTERLEANPAARTCTEHINS